MQAKLSQTQVQNQQFSPQAGRANDKFWRFQNAADGSAELLLYGDISDRSWYGDETTPQSFKADLTALGEVENITVRINSGGGDVWAAQAIGNMLEQHTAAVTACIDGLCASAATIVACHCDKVCAAADTTYMIHPVQVGLCGYLDAAKLDEYKRALDSIKENIIGLYEKKTGQSRDALTAWMDATSWWTAAQAKDKGFVDEVIGTQNAVKTENRNGVLFINSVNTGLLFASAPEELQSKAAIAASGNITPAATPANQSHEEGKNDMEIKTLDDARKAFPDLITQAETAAANAAKQAEQQRLKEIDAIAKLYPADTVDKAKYGETACDAKELAYRAAQDAAKDEAASVANYLSLRAQAAQASGVQNVGSTPPPANQNQNSGEDEIINALNKNAKK